MRNANNSFQEPQTTIYKWMFQLDDSNSLHKKWLFHQTTIYKWLFGVPGWYICKMFNTSKMASLSSNTCHIFDHLLGLIVTTKRLAPLRMGQTDVNETERTHQFILATFLRNLKGVWCSNHPRQKKVRMVMVTWLHGSWLPVKMHHK